MRNYSSWKENKDRQDSFELAQNDRLKKDINRLEIASKNTAKWSSDAEKAKSRMTMETNKIDFFMT